MVMLQTDNFSFTPLSTSVYSLQELLVVILLNVFFMLVELVSSTDCQQLISGYFDQIFFNLLVNDHNNASFLS
jgi:hypothetical protein